ncbi:neuromedin-K receptor-like [Glandiceps talaboti]
MADSTNYIPSLVSLNFSINSTVEPSPSFNYSVCPEENGMPSLVVFSWTLVFGAMIVTAAVGNLIVLWIVLAHRRMRTVTNYFIVNLALADAMNAIFNVPFPFSYLLYNDWYYGEIYCRIQRFIGPVTVAASVFTLMAIGIDRYIAIVHPMRPRMSKLRAKSIIAAVWMVSMAICIPYLEGSQLAVMECIMEPDDLVPITLRTVCITVWPDGQVYDNWYFWYTFSFTIATYVVPLFAQGICYTIVGVKLWGSQAPGESSNRHKEQLKAKRKVVKMLMFVVIIFAVCWLPIHVYFLLGHYFNEVYSYKYINHIYMAIYWLAMSNSMYNPFIYCCLNDSFRMGFKKVFQWLPCVNYSKDHWSKVLGSGYTRVTYKSRAEVGNSVEVSGRRYAASHASNGHQIRKSTYQDQAL